VAKLHLDVDKFWAHRLTPEKLLAKGEHQYAYMGSHHGRIPRMGNEWDDGLRSALGEVGSVLITAGLAEAIPAYARGGTISKWRRGAGGELQFAHAVEAPGDVQHIGVAYGEQFRVLMQAITALAQAQKKRADAVAANAWDVA
jgi:hypothetical protein